MKKWRENYGTIEQSALAFSLNELFSPVLKSYMDSYSSNQTGDNLSKVQASIDSVREVMLENIDTLLERGEKIELLVDKTDKLNENASKFEKASKRVKNDLICRKIVAIIVMFIVCGFNFGRCKH
eukprot:gene17248-22776_t